MSALYSLRTDGDHYRITKIVDSEPKGSYLVSESECECPAGHRHTCRHRQMLPTMLAHKLCDTHWFFDHDRGGQIVDFNGTSKKLLDELAASAPSYEEPEGLDEGDEVEGTRTQEETAKDTEQDTIVLGEIINPRVDGIPHLGGVYAKDITPVPAGQHCQGSKPWRRL